MQCIVNLKAFDGPLDLLLHLIKKMDVDIHEISIHEIANQYLDYINNIDSLSLDDVSEYLVMAAELLAIKSKSLLPNSNEEEVKEEEEEYRNNLIERLVEYKNYKDLTEILSNMHDNHSQTFTKDCEDFSKIVPNEIKLDDDITVFMLSDALKKLLASSIARQPLDTKITNKDYSITKRSEEIKRFLSKRKKVQFSELFDNFSKQYIIVTFLSILDLSRKHVVEINQENNFENIFITMKEKNHE